MATKKTSTKFDTAHNIETEADLTNKTATVKNLVTGETYAGGGEGLPDISAGDAGKILTVSDELAAEWAANPVFMVTNTDGTLNVSYNSLKNMLQNGIIPYLILNFEDEGEETVYLMRLQYLMYADNSYSAIFGTETVGASGWYTERYVNSSADGNLIFD